MLQHDWIADEGGYAMPYASNNDLPLRIRHTLPAHAQDIFRSAFNAAWMRYGSREGGDPEEIAHKVAWAAVKRRYRKAMGRWVPIEVSLADGFREHSDGIV